MTEPSTSFGLEPEQVERLFRIGEDTKGFQRSMSRNENKGETLRRRLAEPLPLDKSQIDMLPAVLGQLCHTIGLLAGETVLSLVLNPSTDISLIERIKQYGKGLSARAQSEDEHEIATAIYYAAIASALAFHDVRISQFSHRKLATAFSRLSREKWICGELRVLFKTARKYCQEKATS